MLNRMIVDLHIHNVDYDVAHSVMMRLFKMGYRVSISTRNFSIKITAECMTPEALQADINTVVGNLKYEACVDYFEIIPGDADITRSYRWANTTDTTPPNVYDITLNTETTVSKTLYPMCEDYNYTEAVDIIANILPCCTVTQRDDTVIVRYTAQTISGALVAAQRISNALLQDCVAVRICENYTDVVLETLCGLNTAPYGEFNSDYFKD